MRHSGGTLLSFRKILLSLKDFGALEVANLGCELLQGRSNDREHGKKISMPVSLQGLGGNKGWFQPQTLADIALNPGIDIGKGANRSGDHPNRHMLPSLFQTFNLAAHFPIPKIGRASRRDR